MKLNVLFIITLFIIPGSLIAQEAGKDYVQLSEPVEQTEAFRVFGSTFNDDIPSVSLETLITQKTDFEDKTVTTQGTIEKVCQMKGCFFILKNKDSEKQARITFKDYGFFIPTNTTGARVTLNGTFEVHTVSEENAKHYAKDAGKNPDAIQGSQIEYALVATSVKIYKEG